MDKNNELELHKNQAKVNEQIIHITENVRDLAAIVKSLQPQIVELATKYATIKSYAVGFLFCASLLGTGFVWSMKETANQMLISNENTNHTQNTQLELIKNIQENHELRISALEQFKRITDIKDGE